MKISKKELMQIIKEELACANKEIKKENQENKKCSVPGCPLNALGGNLTTCRNHSSVEDRLKQANFKRDQRDGKIQIRKNVKQEAITPDNNADEMQRMHDFKGAEEEDLAHEEEEHTQIDELYMQLERVKEALSQFEAALSTLKGSEKKEHGF